MMHGNTNVKLNVLHLLSSFNGGNKEIQISDSLPYQKSTVTLNTFTAVRTRSAITIK
jgi:hypothetical protein